MSALPLLSARSLRKSFGALKAVDGVDLAVPRGAIKAIIGPNGAGKTTLMNLLSGLDVADSGEVHFDGHPIHRRKEFEIVRLGMARTFQNLRLFPDMTVIENVMVGRHCRTKASLMSAIVRSSFARQEEKDIYLAAESLLDELGLSNFMDEPAWVLPYGKQRLLEFARALASEPKLLLLDEPAAGLNAAEAKDLGRLIRGVQARGVTTVLVEHHMELVMDISDEIVVLNFGAVLAEGRPDEIRNDPRVVSAYLGDEVSLAQDLRS